jgi:hypothetical protein
MEEEQNEDSKSAANNPPKLRKSPSDSPAGNDDPTSYTSAEYQEWPMRGFFKLITIGSEVRYVIESNLEDAQQL